MKEFNIGKDFSLDPSGRFYTDGSGSGESFREDYLKERIISLGEGEKLLIVLDDGVESYGSSFLTEGFAGMVKYGYVKKQEFLNKLELKYLDDDFEFYKNKVIQYIEEAEYNSKEYVSTKKG